MKSWKTLNTVWVFQLYNLKSTSPEFPSYALELTFLDDHQDLQQLHVLHIQVKNGH